RHWRLPSRASVAAGLALVVATVLALSLTIAVEGAPDAAAHVTVARTSEAVLHEVAAAKAIHTVPAALAPDLAQAPTDYGGNGESEACAAGPEQSTQQLCFLGDVRG